jgi:hypothetical protein
MARRLLRVVPALLLVVVVAGCARTSIPGVAVRAQPTTDAHLVANIPESNTPVRVECWSRGQAVQGDPIWYRIASPQEGWVTNYYIRSNGDHANAPSC